MGRVIDVILVSVSAAEDSCFGACIGKYVFAMAGHVQRINDRT